MAGLLDLLFNPGAMNGGLLGQFAQQRRQDEPSPLDTAQWPQGPIGAPGMDAMAQAGPPMNIAPPQAAPQPSYFENGLRGLRSSDSLIGGLLNFATGNDPNADTRSALRQMGVPEGLAPLVAGNPAIVGQLLSNQMGLNNRTDDIKEFEYAKKEEPNLTFQQFMQRKRAVTGEYGMQPIYGERDGKPVVLQLGKGGDMIESRVPNGIQISSGVEKVDLGTKWMLRDKKSGVLLGYEPKDIAGKEREEEIGKSQGQAQVALPAALNQAQYSMKLIDDMISHPGRETATGLSGKLDPRNYFAGTDATNFRVRSDQLQGRTFLQAFESLRGAGAITEEEGKKATAAVARLNTSQSDEEYVASLKELREVITSGLGVLRQKASGGKPATPTTPSAPDPLGIR